MLGKPTTGQHMSAITHLLAIMNRLVDGGNTVIVIEHNMGIIRNEGYPDGVAGRRRAIAARRGGAY